jgi:hypothetical protein
VTAQYYEDYADQYQEFVGDGKAARPDPQGRSANVIENIEVNGDIAEVQQCVTDGHLVIDRETEEVLDDSLVSTRLRTTAERTPDGWRFVERSVVQEFSEEDQCGAE